MGHDRVEERLYQTKIAGKPLFHKLVLSIT